MPGPSPQTNAGSMMGLGSLRLVHEKIYFYDLPFVGASGMRSAVDISSSGLADSVLCGRLYLLESGTEQLTGKTASAGAGLALPHPTSGLCPIAEGIGQRFGRPSPPR